MSNSELKLIPYEDRLNFIATAKIICRNQNVTSHQAKPSKRYGHLSFIFKGKLYVQGGCVNQGKSHANSNTENKANIYCINLDKQRFSLTDEKKTKKGSQLTDNKWQVLQTKFTPNTGSQFQTLSYAAYCLFSSKKRLYTFGGSNSQGKTSNTLFRLDIDDLEWSKPEQKGTVPKARQDANLYHYAKNQKNYLILYGGANYETFQIFSDIYFYQIQTKFWFQCHHITSHFIQPRLNPAVTFNENKIYIFGGYYLDAQMNKGYFNDLYEIDFALSIEKSRPYARAFSRRLDQINCFKEDQTGLKPSGRCGSCLIYFKADFYQQVQPSNVKKQNKPHNNWLALIGGEKGIEDRKKIITLNDFWIFSFEDLIWRKIQSASQFRTRSSFSTVYDKQINKFFIFGGLSSIQSVLNDLVSVKITCKSLQSPALKQKHPQQEKQIEILHGYESEIIQELCNNINFPYAAIGMILDNFVNFQARFCDVSYHISKSHPVSQNYIKFESNANFTMSSEIITSHFIHLKGGVRSYVQGTDKKIKTQMNKQNLTKQIGSNFVIGGLRLGNQLVFANLNEDTFEIQIIVILKCRDGPIDEKIQLSSNAQTKSFKLFQFKITKQQILSQDVFTTHRTNIESKKRRLFLQQICSQESKQRLKILIIQAINSIKKGQVKNLFYISKLKTVEGEECTLQTKETELELFPDILKNDVIYGDRQILKQMQMNHIQICQSLDISLKTYISHLYLQCDTQFTVSIHGFQKRLVIVQQYLNKIDELIKIKQVIQVSNDFQTDCKVRQLYHFSNKANHGNLIGKNQSKILVNGILYYQKSRLIKRHDVELGQFVYHYKIKQMHEDSKRSRNSNKCHSNYYSEVFGHIELPQSVPINSTKTDFLFPAMIQKTYTKLCKFDEEIKGQKSGKTQYKRQKK